jgi:hypothetical protein
LINLWEEEHNLSDDDINLNDFASKVLNYKNLKIQQKHKNEFDELKQIQHLINKNKSNSEIKRYENYENSL